MSFNYNKLRGRIIEKYGTLREFSKCLNITYESLSMKLNGKIALSQVDIVTWSEMLEIEPEEYGAYFFNVKVQMSEQKAGD